MVYFLVLCIGNESLIYIYKKNDVIDYRRCSRKIMILGLTFCFLILYILGMIKKKNI